MLKKLGLAALVCVCVCVCACVCVCVCVVFFLRILSERTLEIDEELSVCFIDLQKAFDRVSWTKLMQILKEIGIDWRERRLISNLYVVQSVKVRMNQGKIV